MRRILLTFLTIGAVAVLWLTAAPSSSTTCVRSVDDTASGAAAAADLASALADANGSGCADWRVELSGTFPLAASLVWDEPFPLHLIGPAGSTARLERAGTDHRLLTLGPNAGTAAMTLERLVLAGGDVERLTAAGADEGGAVLADTLHLIDVELIGNTARKGGAVSTFELTATRTSFVNNSADLGASQGGAVYAVGDVTLTNVTFTGNTARSGGALFVAPALPPAALTMTSATLRGNEAAVGTGGADLHVVVANAADLALTLRGVLLAEVGGGLQWTVLRLPDRDADVELRGDARP